MATYAFDFAAKRFDDPKVTGTVTLHFRSRVRTLPDFVLYRITREYDADYHRFVYGHEPACDIFGQFVEGEC